MLQQPNQRATGHVKLVPRKRGDRWYVKYRRPDGRQIESVLGPAWTGNGRPPAGHYTRRTAEEALQAILTDLRRGVGSQAGSGARFADAATEYLRYVEDVRKIDIATSRTTAALSMATSCPSSVMTWSSRSRRT